MVEKAYRNKSVWSDTESVERTDGGDRLNETEQFVRDNWTEGTLIRKTSGCDFEIDTGGLVEVKRGEPTGLREKQMKEMADAHDRGDPVYLAVVRDNSMFTFQLKEVMNYVYKEQVNDMPQIKISKEAHKKLEELKEHPRETFGDVIDRLLNERK
ncbi:MAG: hypothetical protein KAV87_67495 [Desulfobacteraceae bacterium]|nr:hypothetical protein [Desulfobacteraceae bacterium]